MNHYELCKLTAEWQLKKSMVVLYEYQSFATGEFPDVLCFKNGYTRLYEIKVGRQDFLKDNQKDCRIQTRIKYMPNTQWNKTGKLAGINWIEYGLQEFYQEYPHLGRQRWYVCPAGLIQPGEVGNGWGLYWYKNGKFYEKKESKSFKCNIYAELSILEHAFRKHACEGDCNILINKYK